jgi:hypothetical protein
MELHASTLNVAVDLVIYILSSSTPFSIHQIVLLCLSSLVIKQKNYIPDPLKSRMRVGGLRDVMSLKTNLVKVSCGS